MIKHISLENMPWKIINDYGETSAVYSEGNNIHASGDVGIHIVHCVNNFDKLLKSFEIISKWNNTGNRIQICQIISIATHAIKDTKDRL